MSGTQPSAVPGAALDLTGVELRPLPGVSEDAVAAFREGLRGGVLRRGEPGYEEARRVWNGMIDRTPALIVRAAGAADVRRTVDLARDHGLPLAVRGGGHNIAGSALCDDGVVLDLSSMRTVRVDPVARTARVDPGCTLADVDAETQAFGLAVPTGINSTTGIAGLALGGGFGWLSRAYGLTCDNLLSADVVTADGALVHASAAENPDLFWALRGGGGNFGVVTSFEFSLHPVGPEVLAGLVVHPFADAREVLRRYRDFVAAAPDELTVWAILRKAPPLPFLPPEWHGREVLVLAACHAGDPARGELQLAPLRGSGRPVADVVGKVPFAAWQQAFDPLLTPGARNYWKSHDFVALGDALVDTLLEACSRLPTPQCEVFVGHLGGAAGRVAPDATAYRHRDAEFVVNVHTRWDDPADDARCVAWARELFERTAPVATGGVYVNFMPGDETDRVRAAYGANYDRLATLKRRYDSENLFRHNQNARPAGA